MLKIIDTSRWLCGEKRVVFMSPDAQETAPVPVVEVKTAPVATEKSDADKKQEAIDTKKAALAGKVESAKGVVANLKALYGENEQGIDAADALKDPEVIKLCDALSAKLNGMEADFTTKAATIESDYQVGLDALEASLIAEFALNIQPTGAPPKDLETITKENVGSIVDKDVATVDADLAKLETARDADKKAFEDAKTKISEYEEFIVDYVSLNPDKAQAFAALSPIINGLKTNSEYKKNGINIDSAALTTATAALDKAFTEKVQALTGKSYDQLKAETIHVSEAQLKIGRSILGARRETPTSINGGNIMGTEGLAARGITDAEHFNIKSFVEQPKGEPLAVEVMDYSEVSFTQVFADQAAFARMYRGITLPEKGKTATVPEVKWLPSSMPSPFGGLRRERSLTISVDKKSGAITVDVSKIQFGEPPNQSSEVKIPFRKPIDQLTARDALCPNNDYKPGSGTDGTASEAGSESVETAGSYLAKLNEYKTLASPENLKKLDAFKEASDKWPVYLQDRLNNCRQLPGRIDDIKGKFFDNEAFKSDQSLPDLAREMEQISKYDTLLKVLAMPAPGPDDFGKVPELKEYYDLMDKDKGLNYNEGANARGGYDIGQFKSDFEEAGNILNNKFLDNLGNPHVSLVGVHMVFALGQNSQKSVSGTFTLHVNGYEGEEPITFSFSNVGGGTWEKAVAQAMEDLTKDKKKGGTLDTVEKQEKEKEHMEFVRGKVDEREKENLADRIRSIQKHGTEDYDAFDDWDYKGDSRPEVEANIKKDFGNVYEYAYKEVKPGKWAAVRLCERGKTPPAADEKFGKAVNSPEKILVAHEQGEVDKRELKNLAKRQDGKQKNTDYNPESDPDYEGVSNEAVVAAITAEHGNPAEYDIHMVKKSGEFVAIRKCPRGTPGGEASGKFGVAAGLVEELELPFDIDQLRDDFNINVTMEDGEIKNVDTSRVFLQTINGEVFNSSTIANLPLTGKEIKSVHTNNFDGFVVFHLIDSETKDESSFIFSTEKTMTTGLTPSSLEKREFPFDIDRLENDFRINTTIKNGEITNIDTSNAHLQIIDGNGFRSVIMSDLPLTGEEIKSVYIDDSNRFVIFHLVNPQTKTESSFVFSTAETMPAGLTPSNLETGSPDTTNTSEVDVVDPEELSRSEARQARHEDIAESERLGELHNRATEAQNQLKQGLQDQLHLQSPIGDDVKIRTESVTIDGETDPVAFVFNYRGMEVVYMHENKGTFVGNHQLTTKENVDSYISYQDVFKGQLRDNLNLRESINGSVKTDPIQMEDYTEVQANVFNYRGAEITYVANPKSVFVDIAGSEQTELADNQTVDSYIDDRSSEAIV